MKEHPIICQGGEVRAILAELQTQTRRVMNVDLANSIDEGTNPVMCEDKYGEHRPVLEYCPYGKVGDRLWVREAFCEGEYFTEEGEIWYRANPDDAECFEQKKADGESMKWKPSIHMPRWASRITLEVTNIRVERVQEISEEDAIAEGLRRVSLYGRQAWTFSRGAYPSAMCPIVAFRHLWDTINAKRGYGWDTNPWVWAVTFKLVEEKP